MPIHNISIMRSRDVQAEFEKYRNALKPYAFLDTNARRRYDGHDYNHGWLDAILGPFETDVHNIIGSKMARRLSRVAQVMPSPVSSYTRDRWTHSEDVANYARIAATLLGLNVPLTVAIAYAHDAGQGPYGHRFESWYKKRFKTIDWNVYSHEAFGVFALQHVERKGRGLNLTHQVLSGVLHHSLSSSYECHESQESVLVSKVDKIAYLTADVSDALHGRYGTDLVKAVTPAAELLSILGEDQRAWVTGLLLGLCQESAEAGHVSFENSLEATLMIELRNAMYEVYPKVAPEIGSRQLTAVFDGMCDPGLNLRCNPALIMALLDDAAINGLYELCQRYGGFERRHLIAHSDKDLIETLECRHGYTGGFVEQLAKPDLDW